MLRVLNIIFNPIGWLVFFVFGRLGRAIDRQLSPRIGFYVAIVVAFFLLSVAGSAIYAGHAHIGRTIGVLEAVKAATVPGTVIGVVTLKEKIATIRQRVEVRYRLGGQGHILKTTETQPISQEYAVGDEVTLFVAGDGTVALKDPNDSFFQTFVAGIVLIVSLACCYWAWRYFAHRKRLFDTARIEWRQVEPAVVIRGNNARVPSTAERTARYARKRK